MKLHERDYWLGFNIFPGIGPKRFYYLLKKFGSASKAWQASGDQLKETNLPKDIVQKFLEFRKNFVLTSEVLRLEKYLIKFLIIDDEEYPNNLKKIDTAPPLIYIKGRILPQDSLSIAVVGTRKITAYGREVTEKLVRGLTAFGITIVSGLARGVDSVAHRVALGNAGRTLAVLGSGLDRIYPPENKVLAEKIVSEDQGAIISELALGTPPFKGHFPSRNRLISGLSLGVLVTEGASNSGTKITSQYCLEQKRKLMAVPGPITSCFSDGPADLINQGAKLVVKAEDIIREIKISKTSELFLNQNKIGSGQIKGAKVEFHNQEEAQIWQALTFGVKHIDELIRETQLSSDKILSLLTTLEVDGKVKNIGNGQYIII